jgi:hypothetical protein
MKRGGKKGRLVIDAKIGAQAMAKIATLHCMVTTTTCSCGWPAMDIVGPFRGESRRLL